ncbi:DUF411 domain-containing protein [Nitratireductor sp. GISD-1A_MAKvit]|uniref:DUF411 domain-containing protein n=1 Tax=Nitratireductor sp. GISD-1A_MAKvit TaxID=3234198 RepID=UPI0034672D99
MTFKHKFSRAAGAAIALLATLATAHAAAGDDRSMTVFKTPYCGCCELWADAMERAGFHIKTVDLEDLSTIKKQAGVSAEMESCHTAVIDGDRKYVLEGHVPLEALEKLLTERPDIRGIAVPGMPVGSLGMGDDPAARYTVYSIGNAAQEKPSVFFEAGVD